MPIFDAGSPAYQTNTVGSAITSKVWSGTYTPLAGISPAVSLRDVTVVNTGPGTLIVAMGGTIAPTATVAGGMAILPGGQLTIQGWTATRNTTTNDVYGISLTGATCAVEAGLATLASVV